MLTVPARAVPYQKLMLKLLDFIHRDKTSGLRNRWKHEADADNTETILEIPELDGDNEEDMAFQVAEAPRARNNRMQTMAELDNDQQYNLPSNSDIDIDLSLLIRCLVFVRAGDSLSCMLFNLVSFTVVFPPLCFPAGGYVVAFHKQPCMISAYIPAATRRDCWIVMVPKYIV